MKEDDLIRNINPFGLRMQPALKAKIEEAAQANHRSINAEITARLEESFESKPVGPMTIGYMLEKIAEIGEASGRSITVTFGEAHKTKDED
ncbi:Arc family DNA-binding protein [Pseudomonas tructae]|uniref:Arc family DNA-binding protein n=1 Tax=Pseudomonas tructae TaxID=2518644 RepID=A0A411MK35_9PSED|nr:Arc family DNA-binding protein [Pseudomonas tructae]QBF27152.1 Arc family DNA-binding protein [Pseudomonas tructae]